MIAWTRSSAPLPFRAFYVNVNTCRSLGELTTDKSYSHVSKLLRPKLCKMSNPVTKFDPNPNINRTLASQDKLPKLPIPPLEDTCRRYLTALEALQDEKEHELTKRAVKDFLEGDGPKLQKRLQEWAKTKARWVFTSQARSVV